MLEELSIGTNGRISATANLQNLFMEMANMLKEIDYYADIFENISTNFGTAYNTARVIKGLGVTHH